MNLVRLVVDTNVFVEARFNHGKAVANLRLIQELVDGTLILVYSPEIKEEAERVLKEMHTPDYLSDKVCQAFLNGENVSNPRPLNTCPEDPSDNKFLDCAVSAQVPYIISKDRHLKDLDGYAGIKVLTADEFYNVKER